MPWLWSRTADRNSHAKAGSTQRSGDCRESASPERQAQGLPQVDGGGEKERGPGVTPYYAQPIQNAPVTRRPNAQAVRPIFLVIIASALLVSGFIYAIYQHAEAVQDGYKLQQLMLLRQELEREKQRLELERAHARSPQVIEPLARSMGLVRPDSSQVIITDTNGEMKRWIPATSQEAMSSRSPSVVGGPSTSTDNGAPATDNRVDRRQRELNSTAPAVRARPKRVEAAASAPTRREEANADADEAPQAWLGGVLTFPEGQAELKLEKTRKRNQR